MENIRNFSITAHINHGKSTLADRFLEITRTVTKEKMQPQYLDAMDLERERGITIKMTPVRMEYQGYVLNLIDTPGHVDFSYEVSRSLAAVEGVVLLVDAIKGIQAQTLANLDLARKQNLVIIPVINKIDLENAEVEKNVKELSDLLKVKEEEIIKISAKQGTNVEELLKTIIEKIPPPTNTKTEVDKKETFRGLIFDSEYDSYKGTIAFVRIFDGEIKSGEKIYLMANKTEGEAKEIGYFKPEFHSQKELKTGEIGYLATGIKEPGKVRVGDTVTKLSIIKNKELDKDTEPLPGYQESKPMVFTSIYPEKPDDYDLLKEGMIKLQLNDPSLMFEPETKEGLGRGFRCGFLGTLHAEIISERLKREFNLDLVISTPQVLYKVINQDNEELFIYSASQWPTPQEIKETKEPWLTLEILTPESYLGRVLELLQAFEAKPSKETRYLSQDRILLTYQAPLRTIITGFYDKLKGVSQGFASMNYEFLEYRQADLVKLEILIAGEPQEAFSKIVSKKEAFFEGRKFVKKLKETLPLQLFSVALQAVVDGKIIARETIRAKGKDVIAPLYGGDYTRKRKLLERQKKGKKELKEKGRIKIPSSVYLKMFK